MFSVCQFTFAHIQLDLSNAELHRSIIKTALDRGANIVGRICKIDGTRCLSSNGTSPLKKKSSNNAIDTCNSNKASGLKCSLKQVGGISGSKLPMLTLEPHFILKHMRLNCDKNQRAKDGLHDKTKVYRGVREIAFYEYLQSAISVPCLETYVSGLESLIQADKSRSEVLHLLRFSFIIICGTPNDIIPSNRVSLGSSALLGGSQIFSTMCLLTAYYAGDDLTVTMVKSCASSLLNFMKEAIAVKELSKFTAPYAGLVVADNATNRLPMLSDQQTYLILGDITAPYMYPNVIDIKMGTQTYEPDAPPSKLQRELQKYPSQSAFGFRIVGMRIYDPAIGTYVYRNKKFGTELLCRNDCKDALKEFFQIKDSSQPTNGLCNPLLGVMSKLNRIRAWFKSSNTTLTFYASSLLIAYEGSADIWYSAESIPEPSLKMIDFAHVCRKEGGDPGYVHGIDNLMSILTEILHEKEIF